VKNFSRNFLGALLIEPDVFEDHRGYFMESFNKIKYRQCGICDQFVQDNRSYSRKGTLRGLHYQHPHEQAKLVYVVRGTILDVAVDIRRGSPQFGRWTATILSEENRRQLYIPKGFAHGFCVLSEDADVIYKCTDFYCPQDEGGIRWNDPFLAIDWAMGEPLLSEKDRRYPRLNDIPVERLPVYGAPEGAELFSLSLHQQSEHSEEPQCKH
jgi:dTDP-4-dehydrorhamnose 3,5-epimerase